MIFYLKHCVIDEHRIQSLMLERSQGKPESVDRGASLTALKSCRPAMLLLILLLFGVLSTNAVTTGSRPSARYDMGIAATPNGLIYLFGGKGSQGDVICTRLLPDFLHSHPCKFVFYSWDTQRRSQGPGWNLSGRPGRLK